MERIFKREAVQELLELGLTIEDITMLSGDPWEAIAEDARNMIIILKPYPSREGGLTQEDKEAIYKILKKGATLQKIVHAVKLDAHQVFQFIANISNEEWRKNVVEREE